MSQLALYLAGSVVALLALDGVPPATQQVSTIAASLRSAPAPLISVNRGAKGDRLAVMKRPKKPAPEVAREPSPDRQPLVGCESPFSPVVSPAMAHIVGRCVSALESPSRVAMLTR